MRLDPNKVRFVPSLFHLGIFGGAVRFVGRENTVQLTETALVVEGNRLKVGLLGLELLFRRALAEWSSVAIPYSRIVRVSHVVMPPARILALLFFLVCLFIPAWLYLDDPEQDQWAVVGIFLVIPGVLAGYLALAIPDRNVIVFRTRGGRRTRLVLRLTTTKAQKDFIARLKEYRQAAGRFAREGARPEPAAEEPPPRARWLVPVALVGVFAVTAGGVAFGGEWLVKKWLGDPFEEGAFPFEAPVPTETPFEFKPVTARADGPALLDVGEAFVTYTAFLPDGRLVTGNSTGQVRVWDLAAGRGTEYDWGRGGMVQAVRRSATSPTGLRALVEEPGFFQPSFSAWDVGSDSPPITVEAGRGLGGGGDLSPDGRYIAYAMMDNGRLTVWDTTTRQAVRTWEHLDAMRTSFAPDGRLAVLGWGKLELLDQAPGGPPVKIRCTTPFCFTPDGGEVAVISTDGQAVQRSGTRDGRPRGGFYTPNIRLRWLAYAPGAKVLAAGVGRGGDERVEFWDAGTGEVVGVLPGGDWNDSKPAFRPDGSLLMTARRNEVAVWTVPEAVRLEFRSPIRPGQPRELGPPPRMVVPTRKGKG